MRLPNLLAVLTALNATALAAAVVRPWQDNCVERCQHDFVERFTHGDSFEHRKALRGT